MYKTLIFRVTKENDSVSRESGGTGGDLSGSNNRKENDAITQLRNEFKIAIRDIRNDVC